MFGNAQIKKGADEVRGDYISYDAVTEYYQVIGGGKVAATPGNPEGRIRAVIQPKSKLDKPFGKTDKSEKSDKPTTPQVSTAPAAPLKAAPTLSNPPER
jgi:hypothetical protein